MDKRLLKVEADVERCCNASALVLVDGVSVCVCARAYRCACARAYVCVCNTHSMCLSTADASIARTNPLAHARFRMGTPANMQNPSAHDTKGGR